MEYKRDLVREEIFASRYHIKPEIYLKYEINPDYTFKTMTLKFKYGDREWILGEVYEGNTNMTKYCSLTGIEDKFINPRGAFNDAELKLVELMKNGNPR